MNPRARPAIRKAGDVPAVRAWSADDAAQSTLKSDVSAAFGVST